MGLLDNWKPRSQTGFEKAVLHARGMAAVDARWPEVRAELERVDAQLRWRTRMPSLYVSNGEGERD